MTNIHILNLGAGVQSTSLYLLMADGVIPKADWSIYADTQEDPAAIYSHLEWLKSRPGPPIRVVTAGKLGDDIIKGRSLRSKKGFTSIPAFTTPRGMIRRQCTSDYKIRPIEQEIRRGVLGLKPRQRVPKHTTIHQYYGISADESSRATRIYERSGFNQGQWRCHFPLIDHGWNRDDCRRYLETVVPHPVPRSACVFCPFHNDKEWEEVRRSKPDWDRAVEVDEAIRTNARAARDTKGEIYLHSKRIPLTQISFGNSAPEISFENECEGGCGI